MRTGQPNPLIYLVAAFVPVLALVAWLKLAPHGDRVGGAMTADGYPVPQAQDDRGHLLAPQDGVAIDERAKFAEFLELQEGIAIRRRAQTGVVTWNVFSPGSTQQRPGRRRPYRSIEERNAAHLMYPDNDLAQLLRTATASYDEVWLSAAKDDDGVEAYFDKGRFVVWFKTAENIFTRDKNRVATGDRAWFRNVLAHD